MNKIKICIADDHTLFRKSFANLLRSFNRVGSVREASNGKELLELANKEIPDFAILDLEMPIMNGYKTCEQLVRDFPEVKIIVVSMHDAEPYVFDILQKGAHAVLSKDAEPEELEKALYDIFDKGNYSNQKMRDALRFNNALLTELSYPKGKNIDLSERELMVVRLITKQYTNKQISRELSLSENTIRNHKVRIMRKIGVKNVAGLVEFVLQSGLVLMAAD